MKYSLKNPTNLLKTKKHLKLANGVEQLEKTTHVTRTTQQWSTNCISNIGNETKSN